MYAIWPINLDRKDDPSSKRPLFDVGGEVCTVETAVLRHLAAEGHQGAFTGNEVWWQIAFLLFFDQIFVRIPEAFSPQLGAFPGTPQEIPRDLVQPDFYERRDQLLGTSPGGRTGRRSSSSPTSGSAGPTSSTSSPTAASSST